MKINGFYGEEIATQHLKEKGYQILERNFRKKWGEIDIVCYDKKHKELVFIEVKTSNPASQIFPEERLTSSKIKRLKKAILSYLSSLNQEEIKWRFDFISIYLDPKNLLNPKIKYYQNQELEY